MRCSLLQIPGFTLSALDNSVRASNAPSDIDEHTYRAIHSQQRKRHPHMMYPRSRSVLS